MKKDEDPKVLTADLHERKNLLVLLVSEYEDRLKFDDLRGDERERSIEELSVIKTQIQSIDTTLAEMEDKQNH